MNLVAMAIEGVPSFSEVMLRKESVARFRNHSNCCMRETLLMRTVFQSMDRVGKLRVFATKCDSKIFRTAAGKYSCRYLQGRRRYDGV